MNPCKRKPPKEWTSVPCFKCKTKAVWFKDYIGPFTQTVIGYYQCWNPSCKFVTVQLEDYYYESQ